MKRLLAIALILSLLLCALPAMAEAAAAIPEDLVGEWRGTGTPKNGGPAIDLTATINADGSGEYTFDQSGYHESYPFTISSDDSAFSVDIPADNTLGIARCEGSWALESGILKLDITTTFASGGSYAYTAECEKAVEDGDAAPEPTEAPVGDSAMALPIRDGATLACGSYHTVGVKADGTVVATGASLVGQCNVDDWTDVVAVAAGEHHTVGLRADGTVLATGHDEKGQCDVQDWTGIVAIAAGGEQTVGLKADGKVVATGKDDSGQCETYSWANIVAIACGKWETVGLRADGKVISKGGNTEKNGAIPPAGGTSWLSPRGKITPWA